PPRPLRRRPRPQTVARNPRRPRWRPPPRLGPRSARPLRPPLHPLRPRSGHGAGVSVLPSKAQPLTSIALLSPTMDYEFDDEPYVDRLEGYVCPACVTDAFLKQALQDARDDAANRPHRHPILFLRDFERDFPQP